MRLGKLSRLMLKNVARSWRTLFFSSIGVVVGVAILLFFVSLRFGLETVLREKIFPSLPPNEIEVVPEVFATGQKADSFLSDEDLQKIRALPKVVGVHRRLDCTFPATAYLEEAAARRFFKKALPQMDLFVDGVSATLVQGDKQFHGRREKFAFQGDDLGKPIPVVISNSLYSLYLTSVAPSLKLPVFAKDTFLGFRFNIRLGVGIARGRARQGEIKERYGEIVGFSNYGNRAGVTIPSEYLEVYNREYEGPEAAKRYKSLIVKTASAEDKAEVIAKLRELKFRPDVNFLEEMVFKVVTTLAIIFTIVSAVIILVSAIQIMHTFFMLIYERRSEIGLLRALGATRGAVRWLIVSEAFFVGLIAGTFGVAFGFGATLAADRLVTVFLPAFSQLDSDSFFRFPPVIVFGAVGFAAVFCTLGALLPARRAAGMEPAQALSTH